MAAKKKTTKKKKSRPKTTSKKVTKSRLSKQEIFLDEHDEEKILLFATGIAFGIALTVAALKAFWYTGLVIIVMMLIFWFIEQRA